MFPPLGRFVSISSFPEFDSVYLSSDVDVCFSEPVPGLRVNLKPQMQAMFGTHKISKMYDTGNYLEEPAEHISEAFPVGREIELTSVSQI